MTVRLSRWQRALGAAMIHKGILWLLSAVALWLAFSGSAHAATLYWDGTGSSWNTASFWSTASNATTPNPTAPPGAADIASFNISTVNTAQTVNLDAAQSALGLVFSSTGTVLIQTGSGSNTLALGVSGITVNSGAGADTITSTLYLSSAQFWANNSASTFTVNAAVSGNTITANGSGTLSFGGSTDNGNLSLIVTSGTVILNKGSSASVHGVGGGMTISGGLLQLAGSGGDQIGDGTSVTINGGSFDMAGKSETINSLNGSAGTITNSTGSSSSTLTIGGSNGSGTYAGSIQNGAGGTGTVAVIKTGTGSQTLSGANTYTGGTTVSGGTLVLGSGSALGAGAIAVGSGATLDLNGQNVGVTSAIVQGVGVGGNGALINSSATAASLAGSINLSTSASLTVGGTGDIALTGGFNNSGGGSMITKIGSNILSLSGTADNSGLGVVANAGTVVLAKTNSASGHAVGGGGVTVGGGLVQLAGTGSDQIWDGAGVVIASGAFDTNGQSETVAGLNLQGTGIAGGGALVNSANGASTLTPNAGTTLTGNTTIGVTQAAGSLALNNPISGNFNLTKVGAGTLTLTGNNTYSGITTVSAGTLKLGHNNALGSTAGGTVVADGATLDLNGRTISAEPLTIQGAGVGGNGALINSSGTLASFAGDIALAGPTTIGGGITLSGAVTGGTLIVSAGLELTGTTNNTGLSLVVNGGNVHLNKNQPLGNPYDRNAVDGALTINGGTVILANPYQISTVVPLAMNGGTLYITGNQFLPGLTGSGGYIAGGFTGSPTILNLDLMMYSGTPAFSGVISDVGGGAMSVEISNGTQILSGANTYSGFTDVGWGTLQCGTANAIPSRSMIYLVDLGIFDLGGFSQSIGSLTSYPGALTPSVTTTGTSGTDTLTIGNDDTSPTYPYGGVISDASGGRRIAINKVGTGTLTLTGANTFSGGITLTAGTLAVSDNAATGSNTITFSGGTLQAYQASISLNNPIVLASGGTLDGAYNLALTGPASGSGGLTKNGACSATLSGALSFTGPITVNAGTLVLSNVNSLTTWGAVTVSGGTLSFANIGANAFSSNITMNGGMLLLTNTVNNTALGSIRLAVGAQLQLNAPLTNTALIDLNSGSISGAATLTNAGGATILGSGTISAPFNNSGLLVVGNGLSLTQSFFNAGTIVLSKSNVNFTGSAITNTGIIQGVGTLTRDLTNYGLLQPTAGTLTITGVLLNQSGGLIAAATGNTLVATNGLATNTGLINLSGGTFNNNGFTMNNSGTMQGFGTFSFGGAGLTNSGNITFTGGAATINGAVTNSAGYTLLVSQAPATFNGAVVNYGTFVTVGTTINFVGGYTEHGTFHIDPSSASFNGLTVLGGASFTASAGDAVIMTGGSTLTNAGTFSNGGSLTITAASSASNSGSFTQTGAQSWSAGSTFTNTAGAATFASDTGSPSASPLSVIVNGGTVNFSSTQHLAALTINGAQANFTPNASLTNRTSKSISITLSGSPGAWSGKFDLTNNNLIVGDAAHTTSFANIRNQITQAAGTPAPANPWNGTGGITSNSAAAASTTATKTALGYASGTEYTALTGLTLFDSLTFNSTDTLIKYTLVGDANLDGSVNINDFFALSGHINQAGDWSQGDFNYTGTVNINDFFAMTGNFNKTLAVGSLLPAAASTAPAPEPASLVLLLPPLLVLAPRRRTARDRAHIS